MRDWPWIHACMLQIDKKLNSKSKPRCNTPVCPNRNIAFQDMVFTISCIVSDMVFTISCILKYNKLQMSVTFTWEGPVDVARVTLVQSDDLTRRNEYFVDWLTLHSTLSTVQKHLLDRVKLTSSARLDKLLAFFLSKTNCVHFIDPRRSRPARKQ